jgi:hypothetical protein
MKRKASTNTTAEAANVTPAQLGNVGVLRAAIPNMTAPAMNSSRLSPATAKRVPPYTSSLVAIAASPAPRRNDRPIAGWKNAATPKTDTSPDLCERPGDEAPSGQLRSELGSQN